MKNLRHLAWLLLVAFPLSAQNTPQQLTLSGLLTQSNHGSFVAAKYAADGTLFLLLNQQDGIRILHANATATTLLAQAHIGAAGDNPIAVTLDPAGNLYLTGTTTSGTLTGTSGTPFPTRADTSTNSFVAKYDTNLNLLWLTFLGAGRTSATALAATADAVFVTGLTYSTTFPVTASGLQQTPATGSLQNGFVERFSDNGNTLVYATYLTGASGDTTPTALAADASDNTYIAGSTTASGYPTLAALQPTILGTTSGFLTKLTPAGDGFTFSTFIAGNGLTSLALDATTLLLTGDVSLGGFQIATVNVPLVATAYQTLLRLPTDGQSITSSTLLVPGTTSAVTADANGTAWISGTLSTPLFPGIAPLSDIGDTFLLHTTATNTVDQSLRIGGLPTSNATYATLTTTPAAPAISASAIALAGQLTTTVAADLSATQRFDLPQLATPNTLLPSSIGDVPTTCTSGQCTGTAATLSLLSTATSAPSLALSAGDLPNLTLRNLGSATATGLSLSAAGFTLTTNCGATLAPSAQCSVALTGTGPGSITVSAANTPSTTTALPANTLTPDALALSTYELDFGVATTASPISRTLTITNLTATTQTFTSALDHPATTTYSFKETVTDCGTPHTLAANATCHVTLTLTPSSNSANDIAARQFWLLGTRDILLTGFAQAAAINVSATTLDFGTQFTGATALRLPRYLYLSNNGATTAAHAAVALPTTSPFTLTDECPTTLAAHTVCRITLHYLSPTAPADDTLTLNLDGFAITVQGKTLPPQGTTGSTANPNLSVSTTSLTFPTAVVVTGVSGTQQTVTLTNTGSSLLPLSPAITGDFALTNTCPTTLAANASCQLLIAFTPSQPGTRDGLLTLTTTNSFAPTYVTLSGTGTAILPANNGTLALGQTFVGEPVVTWYKLQQPLTTLTATTNSAAFTVTLVTDTGSGHGTLASSAFTANATSACSNCWLGVQFLSGTAGPQTATLELTTTPAGKPYDLTLAATALPVQGLLLSPLTQDFGSVALHSTSARTPFTLANLLTSSTAVTIQSVTVTGDFTLTASNIGGAPCTGQLAATASCFLSLTFSPTVTGQRTGTLTIVTDGGTVTSALSGYGTPDPGLALTPTSLDFENVPGTEATLQTITLTNTGTTPLTLNAPTTSSSAFNAATTCTTLAPSATCTVSVTFQPQNAILTATLALPVITTQNGQTSTTTYKVPLTGNYAAPNGGLTLLPQLANFGALATGTVGQTRQFTLTNNTAKLQSITLNLPRQLPLTTATTCPQLAPGASCVFSVSFVPATNGEATGTLTASATDGTNITQALAYMIGYGNGLGTLSLSSGAALNFAQVTSGQSTASTLAVTNTSTTPITMKRITSQPPFFSTTTCGTLLAANATCAVTLTYTPIDEILSSTTQASPRADTGTLTLESDATSSPTTINLSGTVSPIVSSNPASNTVLATFALSESALTFAATTVGSASSSQTIQLTNTGNATLHIRGLLTPADYNATTTCATLLVTQSCNITVTFAPNSGTTTLRTGTLSILSDAATALEFVTLLATSTPSLLTLSPTALDFGTVAVGTSAQLNVVISNNSATAITFLSTSTTGDYTAARGTCPANNSPLAAYSSCSLTITFTPTNTGTRTGTLSLITNATPLPLTVALTGNATVGHLVATPGALAFGTIAVGSPASLTLTLLNTGTATVTNITPSITGANAADFAITVPCPVTQLAPNQGCSLTVTYTPSVTATEAATLTLTSSDPTSPLSIPLAGTGSAPGSFTLTVNGSNAATVTVASGSPAVFPLMLTPLNGFTGQIALTCTPINPAQYASCSLLASSLTLNGSGIQTSIATINTITSASARTGLMLLALALFPFKLRRRNKSYSTLAIFLVAPLLFTIALSGCGGNAPGSGSKLRYTPAGTYQYQVTATTTSGPQITHTVTLNLIVQ